MYGSYTGQFQQQAQKQQKYGNQQNQQQINKIATEVYYVNVNPSNLKELEILERLISQCQQLLISDSIQNDICEIDKEEVTYLQTNHNQAFFAYFRNGVYFSIQKLFEDKYLTAIGSNIQSMLGVYLSKQKPAFPPNLIQVKTLAEERQLLMLKKTKDLKIRPQKQIEFCILHNIPKTSQFFRQIYTLLPEDIPTLTFYYKSETLLQYDSETYGGDLATLICIDKYYPDQNFTFVFNKNQEISQNSEQEGVVRLESVSYRKLYKMIQMQFQLRNLQEFNQEVFRFARSNKMSILIYIRDQFDHDTSYSTDYSMYEAMKSYKKLKKLSRGIQKDVIFAISDVKEGFHKDFFDGIKIFDFNLPCLIILDFTHVHELDLLKYQYPSIDNFSFESEILLTHQQILEYLLNWNKNQLFPYYINENIENAYGMKEFINTNITRINSYILLNKTQNLNLQHLQQQKNKKMPTYYNIVMFCSLFHHYCIDDLKTYKQVVQQIISEYQQIQELDISKSDQVNVQMISKRHGVAHVKFMYIDSMANDNSDQIAQINDIPCLRVYLPNGRQYMDYQGSQIARFNKEQMTKFIKEAIEYEFGVDKTIFLIKEDL